MLRFLYDLGGIVLLVAVFGVVGYGCSRLMDR